jgi:single-strand DNA-binding protein
MQNIVILAGNIGQDPEAVTTQAGTRITRFTLATSRPRFSDGKVLKDADGYTVQDTEWHRITCFNGLGRTVEQRCKKGTFALVRGRIHYTKWTDRDGVDRYSTEIIAETVNFKNFSKAAEEADDDRDMDDIPF